MTIRIVTDSTCDLPDALVARHSISVVPLYINAGAMSYRDGLDMTRETFYQRLPEFDPPPTTSAPGPSTFAETYARLAQAGATQIVSVHVSGTLSNIVDIARMAAKETRAVPVTVVDSQNLSLATGLAAVAAAEKAEAGGTLEEITAVLREMAACSYTFAALDTVEYLRRGGRMSHVMSTLATLLRVKPLLKMHDGVSTAERVRTSRAATDRLIDLVTQLGPLKRLAVVHTNDLRRANALRQQAKHLFPEGEEPLTVQVTPVIGAHLGPGAAGFVAVTACEVVPPKERRLWLF